MFLGTTYSTESIFAGVELGSKLIDGFFKITVDWRRFQLDTKRMDYKFYWIIKKELIGRIL